MLYKYAMVNRPVGISTCPKDFVAVEPRPSSNKPHHDMARNGVAVYDRKLTDHEMKQYEMALMVEDPKDLAEYADMVIQTMGKYARKYLEDRDKDPKMFENAVLQGMKKSTANSYHPSIGDMDHFLDLVVKRIGQLESSLQPEGPKPIKMLKTEPMPPPNKPKPVVDETFEPVEPVEPFGPEEVQPTDTSEKEEDTTSMLAGFLSRASHGYRL